MDWSRSSTLSSYSYPRRGGALYTHGGNPSAWPRNILKRKAGKQQLKPGAAAAAAAAAAPSVPGSWVSSDEDGDDLSHYDDGPRSSYFRPKAQIFHRAPVAGIFDAPTPAPATGPVSRLPREWQQRVSASATPPFASEAKQRVRTPIWGVFDVEQQPPAPAAAPEMRERGRQEPVRVVRMPVLEGRGEYDVEQRATGCSQRKWWKRMAFICCFCV
ncbi:hypothetical protein MMC16_004115 [Acarospora aff. strigata]|nr:hypothetical protein [Acarospora aff. strigata]